MIFSHTQISQYLRCPRSYRFRYLDGWLEKETRAAMAFGRSFEKALGAYFSKKIPVPRSSRNGVPIGMRPLNTRKGIPGTAWSIREFICCRSSPRTIGFRFLGRTRICK